MQELFNINIECFKVFSICIIYQAVKLIQVLIWQRCTNFNLPTIF